MMRRILIALIVLMPMAGRAQTPIRLDNDDVLFQFAGLGVQQRDHVGSHIARPEIKPSSRRLCGFAITGNHRSHANPHVEWDLNIDQIMTPNGVVAGVSAGTFDVQDHKRTPRSPITHMSFTLSGVNDPVVAEVRGVRNAAENEVVALLQPEAAGQLFAEFQTERPIVISLTYANQSTDLLEVHGFYEGYKFGWRNGDFEECLRGFKTIVPGESITVTHAK